jgi:hypothetical protein
MPQSGPGRQSFRRGSKKRKVGKKEAAASPAGSPVPEKSIEIPVPQQHRLSVAPTGANFKIVIS